MQHTLDRTTVASPPDDGGHHGSFTRPEDETMVPTGDRGPVPPLNTDGTWTNTIDRDEHPHRGLGWVSGTLLLAAISAGVVALLARMAG